MNPKSFYTIICSEGTAPLLKDCGAIPYLLYREYGYKSYYVSYIPEGANDVCTQQVHGLNLVHLKNDCLQPKQMTPPMASKSVLRYIWRNAKKMDICNLYFLKHSILYAITYKIRNSKGILYLKLDLNPDRMFCKQRWTNKVKEWFFKQYLNRIPDIVSAESTPAYQYVKSNLLSNPGKLVQIYNGLDYNLIAQNSVHINSFEEKENIAIVVGRIGSPEKNHELLLRAIPKIKWGTWKLYFIGPITEHFHSKIQELYSQNPVLKETIFFTGPIFDKIQLWEYYNKSKIFFLTSFWEGFSLVLPEAACFGNYIISTPVPPIGDFVVHGETGSIIDYYDESQLAQTVNKLIENDEIMQKAYPQIIEHSTLFHWDNIIKKLHQKILQLYSK